MREKIIDLLYAENVRSDCGIERLADEICAIGSMKWIPFKTRPLTEEEQDKYPEWDCILDCELPDDGQRILVSINLRGHEEVQQDDFYSDDESYLDSGYEIGTEAVAWAKMPEPWKGDGDESNRTS